MSDALHHANEGTPAPPSWRLRLRQWRNRMVADPKFQAFCTKIPGLSQYAQSRANALYGLTAGFVHSQIFASCVSLGVLDALNDRPMSVDALSRQISLNKDMTARLLTAAASIGLVSDMGDGLWALDDLGAVAANDPGILAMVRHHHLLYADLADTPALLRERSRETGIARLWAYSANPEPAGINPADARAYSDLMRISQDAVAREVFAAHDFDIYQEVVDVGGGHGRFLTLLGQHFSKPRLHVFDLPPVAAQANEAFAAQGLGERAIATGGSFFADELPRGAGCYTLIRVLYDHDDANALRILSAVRAAMQPGATLVIAEPMAGNSAAQKQVNAYFSLYLLAMASGRCRTHKALCDMAVEAGFANAKPVSTRQPLYTGMIIARA
jgi:demethylspheroidene O-methyltransferase